MSEEDPGQSQPSTSGHKRPTDDGRNQPPKKSAKLSTKVFNDSVHGHIELHPLLVDIIDTPEFQRLRCIKQMGMSYLVYPGASHNRFEHSIGVCHLAGELARHLQSQQKDLNITKEEILCVEIAGLCHDLGHGPFSHLFDKLVLPKMFEEPDKVVKHEQLSVKMFEYMLKNNQLTGKFNQYGIGDEDYIHFIEDMIEGVPNQSKIGKERGFFLDIVANKRNGIDVDRWDYLARDSLYLGISNLFDWRRYLKFARVLTHKRKQQICIRDKEINNLYDMFHTRYTLHRRACQHRVITNLEIMMADALIAVKERPLLPLKNGEKKSISQSIKDMEVYSKLTDHVIWQIISEPSSSTDKGLEKSKSLIDRIFKRDFYLCIGQTELTESLMQIKEKDVCKDIYDNLMEYWEAKKQQNSEEGEKHLEEGDISVHIAELDYGMNEKNPVENVKFYRKSDPDKAVHMRKIEQNYMVRPRRFSEKILRVFSKKSDSYINQSIQKAFEKWCEDEGLSPKLEDIPDSTSETETSQAPAV